MNDDTPSTATHQEHQKVDHSTPERRDTLLDGMTYKVDKGPFAEMPVSLTDGTLGTREDAEGRGRITAYASHNDVHYDLTDKIYNTEADARAAVAAHQKAVKSHIVIEDDRPASQDEIRRLAAQKLRHAEENKLRAKGTSSGPFLDY